MEYLGSCLCNNIKFKIIGNFDNFYLCHCEYCRKDSGSAHSATLFSSSAKLEWTEQKSKIQVFQLENSRHVKAFCSNCGSALPNQPAEDLILVPAGSLDTPLDKQPDSHIFIGSKAKWDHSLETIKSFNGFPVE